MKQKVGRPKAKDPVVPYAFTIPKSHKEKVTKSKKEKMDIIFRKIVAKNIQL